MPIRFDRYRFKDGVTPLSEDTFNSILKDIDLRIAALEDLRVSWADAVNQLTELGLVRINEALGPSFATLQSDIAAAEDKLAQLNGGFIADAPDQVTDAHIGSRTADPDLLPADNTGTLTQWLGRLANRIRAITGATNWYDAPATTLATAAAHASNVSNPHTTTAAQVGALPLAGGTMSGAINMANNAINNAKTVGFQAEYDNGNSGASATITLANGQKQKITLTAATTLTVSTTGAPVGNYVIRLIQDATGGRTVAWSGLSGSRWLGSASAPAINTAANGETLVSIYWDGANLTQSLAKVGAA